MDPLWIGTRSRSNVGTDITTELWLLTTELWQLTTELWQLPIIKGFYLSIRAQANYNGQTSIR